MTPCLIRVNWVKPQFDTLIKVAFCSLHKQVSYDIDEANSTVAGSGINLGYELTEIDKEPRYPKFMAKRVTRYGPKQGEVHHCIEFVAQGEEIYVYSDPGSGVLFFVTRQWDEERLQCDWIIGGEPHELWQVSRRSLRDLIFPA